MARRKRQITYVDASPAPVEQAVAQVGTNIATARLRRRWRQQDLAEKAGITRATLVSIERGKLGTGIGAYVAVLWALGLHGEVSRLASPERDAEGLTLEAARLPSRARPTKDLDDDF
ncbi:MAG TPA: helix-turn-helix domain-containing protein [Longimicrobium sp.]|nr:helix-turn-helix domain-containing protein [Longimicrobium sp.]